MSQHPNSASYRRKLEKLWQKHQPHIAWLTQQAMFPYELKIKRPSEKELMHQYDQVQASLTALRKQFNDQGVTLTQQQIQYPKMGRQWLPVAVTFDTVESLARLLGELKAWQRFTKYAKLILTHFPNLHAWLTRHPEQVLNHAEHWPKLLATCAYFVQHPRPNRYMRELDIPGVNSKLIETHQKILKSLLDELLPSEAIASQYSKLSEHGFEKRFGLKFAPPRVRFRLLDPNMWGDFAGASDLELPIAQFTQLDLLCDQVFITENKTNGLSFPELRNAMVIFGLGYGVDTLKQVRWLQDCQLYYWGDIDTHGFAILSQFRSYFPKAQSFLMDEET